MGVVYCALAAVGLQSHAALPTWQFLFYGAWLAIGAVCVYALLRWEKWGVVGFDVAALVVSLVNLVQGSVTLQGVSFGVVLTVVLATALRPAWHHFD